LNDFENPGQVPDMNGFTELSRNHRCYEDSCGEDWLDAEIVVEKDGEQYFIYAQVCSFCRGLWRFNVARESLYTVEGQLLTYRYTGYYDDLVVERERILKTLVDDISPFEPFRREIEEYILRESEHYYVYLPRD